MYYTKMISIITNEIKQCSRLVEVSNSPSLSYTYTQNAIGVTYLVQVCANGEQVTHNTILFINQSE